jgi:phosphatidylinositol alpha-mannosyltransferase
MPVLLKAWPDIHRRTGARLRLVGADPLAVQLLLARHRIPHDGIDILGFLPQDRLTEELLRAKALAVPSVGQESFGMVLTRGFACAVPVVASDIPGDRAVMTDDTGVLFPPGDADALTEALVALFEDEPRRRSLGARARQVAVERYSWDKIAVRLEQIYTDVAA